MPGGPRTAITPASVGETIVRAIVTMARALDFYVVAEGVETDAEFEVVRQLRYDAAQGFFLQGPLPPDELEEAMALRAPSSMLDGQA